MTQDPSDSPANFGHSTPAAPPVDVTATSETSWLVSTGDGSILLGHITHDGDMFTAYDTQELPTGAHPTLTHAITAVTTGTPTTEGRHP